MSEALSTTAGEATAPHLDPDGYHFDIAGAGSPPFRSVLDDVSAAADDQRLMPSSSFGDEKAHDTRDHGAADNLQLPPDQPPGGSGPAAGFLGASAAWAGCVAVHTLAGAAKGAVVGGVSGAMIGAGYGAAGGAAIGTLAAPGVGTVGAGTAGFAGGALIGGTIGLTDGAYLGSAAGLADGLVHCGETASQPRQTDHIVETRWDTGLTRPTAPIGGTPGGIRSTSEPGATSEKKAGIDSENQVADKTAAAGYPTIQNPTEGPNPPLTPERMIAEGLKPNKKPDLLLSNRVFDTYTPRVDAPASIRTGVAEKIEAGQTHRVVVDLRQTTQTEASVRAILRAQPISGLKEVIVLTEHGLGQPFRP